MTSKDWSSILILRPRGGFALEKIRGHLAADDAHRAAPAASAAERNRPCATSTPLVSRYSSVVPMIVTPLALRFLYLTGSVSSTCGRHGRGESQLARQRLGLREPDRAALLLLEPVLGSAVNQLKRWT